MRTKNIGFTPTAQYKSPLNDLQNITQNTKERATRHPVKAGNKLMCSGVGSQHIRL